MAEKPKELDKNTTAGVGNKVEGGEKKENQFTHNFVEKLSVQEKRKLESTREALDHARHEEKHEKEKEIADENLQKIKNSFAPSLRNAPIDEKQTKLQVNQVNVEKYEDGYREQIKKTYEAEMAELKEKPQEKNRKLSEYLDTYISDISINPNNIKESDLKKLRETLPEAYIAGITDLKLPIGKSFKEVRDGLIKKAKESLKREDFKDQEAYDRAVQEKLLKIAGIDHADGEANLPKRQDFKDEKAYQNAIENSAKNRGKNIDESLQKGRDGGHNYVPMTPSSNFSGHTELKGEQLPKGENFKTWLEKSPIPQGWRQLVDEFTKKLDPQLDTNTPLLVANKSANRAIFIHKGRYQEFPVIFGSGGFGDGKGQTPIGKVETFNGVKIADSPQGDASVTGSTTIKGASILSDVGSQQGGKWWHGVDPARLNGGHTAGCVGLDPTLAMNFAKAVQESGRGFGYVN